jgi:hypothetical protein
LKARYHESDSSRKTSVPARSSAAAVRVIVFEARRFSSESAPIWGSVATRKP